MKSAKNKNVILTIFRRIKINFLKVYYARGSAHEIALGASIGAFWGVFPTFGLSTILSVLLYKFFRFNLIAAISAAFISNPLTSPLLLFLSYEMGTLFVQTNIQFNYENWSDNLLQIGTVLLIGSAIISTITALPVYFITKWAIEHRRKVKLKNLNTN